MTMDKWVKKNLGKGIDYDGAYGVQCVDLIKSFIKNVLGVTPQSIGNAIEYYNKRNTSPYLKKNFRWFGYKKGFVPEKGDICVFSTKSGLGHVSVATGAGNAGYFYSYDQNYPRGKHEPMTKIKHSYASLLGVLRPYNQTDIKTNKPSVNKGKSCVFTTRPYCRANIKSKAVYKVSDLSAFTSDSAARLKKGTSVKAESVITVNNNIWISYKLGGRKVWSLVYNYAKDKPYIK
ncbi:MAG: CHAP domain-containing protein [Eubacterium sp.]|nr:CHAP domain-containing protein [Eubacterium sp.]